MAQSQQDVARSDLVDDLFDTDWTGDGGLLLLKSPVKIPDEFAFTFASTPDLEGLGEKPVSPNQFLPAPREDASASLTACAEPAGSQSLPSSVSAGSSLCLENAPTAEQDPFASSLLDTTISPLLTDPLSVPITHAVPMLFSNYQLSPPARYSAPHDSLARYPAFPFPHTYIPQTSVPIGSMHHSTPQLPATCSGRALHGYSMAEYPDMYASNGDRELEPHKKIDHKRARKRNPSNDPKEIYEPSPPSRSWGPLDRKGKPLFQYNLKHVELDMYKRYEKHELLSFFTGQGAFPGRPPNRSLLTLWIQNTPAQTNFRYHSGSISSKCRWAQCSDRNNTILKGFWRVAFDENSDRTGRELDPFLNAGYVHLYCLEKMFKLEYLLRLAETSKAFRILPDLREFPRETRNPMAITRDHPDMYRVFMRWQAAQTQKQVEHHEACEKAHPTRPLKRRRYNKEDCLWYWLTTFHLDNEVKGRSQTREARNGADLSKHRGDLGEYIRLKQEMNGSAEDSDNDSELVPAAKRTSDGSVHLASRSSGGEEPRKRRRIQQDDGPQTLGMAEQFPAMAKFGLRLTPRTPKHRPAALDLARPLPSPGRDAVLSRTIEELQHRPVTRKRSREVAELIEQEAQGHLTRRRSQQLSPLIDSQPAHLRSELEQVVSAQRPLITPGEIGILSTLPESKRRKVRNFVDQELASSKRHMSH